MTDLQTFVAPTCDRLADLLGAAPAATWEAPSLCAGWQVRHVVAHVTMPARSTPEQFGAELAVGGDFDVLADTVAARDASLPVAHLLDQLRSPELHAWQPPGGGAVGALSHAVIHSLDVTIALDRPAVAPLEATTALLDQLTASDGAWFGVDLTGVRLEAADTDWSWGRGDPVRADSGSLLALLSGRTLPDGRALPTPLTHGGRPPHRPAHPTDHGRRRRRATSSHRLPNSRSRLQIGGRAADERRVARMARWWKTMDG